ncbi:MAG TPA: hypothetical protein VNX68_14090 [Nitrosopumilaceae archaeon]|jgi:hypothetical protein|nr:hypothetical protein [Nitrosopumilaceae archaeon]
MQKTTTAILAISIAAITVSFIAANGMLPTTFLIAQSNQPPNINDKSVMLGHVTYVVKDPNGHIKAYAQTDNSRTVEGVNCAEQILFNPNNGQKLVTNNTNSACPGMDVRSSTGFNGFNVIGILNGSSTTGMVLNGSDNISTSKIGGSRTGANYGIIVTANQGASVQGTVAGTATYNQITITSPAFTFTGDKAAGTNIRGSFLLNNTGSGANVATFAENTFTGGGVAVASGDTLTVTWTITLT